jgi:hypothetical protein
MPDTLPPSVPPREPRTYELRDEQWVEAGAGKPPRPSPWLLVPLVLMAVSVAALAFFAALVALFTGGLLDLRRRFIAQGERLRDGIARILRR